MSPSHISSDSSNEMRKSHAIIENTFQTLQGGHLSQENILGKDIVLEISRQFTSL